MFSCLHSTNVLLAIRLQRPAGNSLSKSFRGSSCSLHCIKLLIVALPHALNTSNAQNPQKCFVLFSKVQHHGVPVPVLIRDAPPVLSVMDLPGCSVGEGRLNKVIHLNLTVSNGSTIQQRLRVHYGFPTLKTSKEEKLLDKIKGIRNRHHKPVEIKNKVC